MFTVTARTVLELGAELISSDVIAFYELIKNGFDAKSKSGVTIRFQILLTQRAAQVIGRASIQDLSELRNFVAHQIERGASSSVKTAFEDEMDEATSLEELRRIVSAAPRKYNRIIVEDTGDGMSAGDLKSAFLVIGTSSRRDAVAKALDSGEEASPYLGEKGIGRLSAMRLGDTLKVMSATKADTNQNILKIDWNDFSEPGLMLEDIDVKPRRGPKKEDPSYQGTKLYIGELQKSWSREKVTELGKYDFARLIDPRMPQKQRPKVTIFYNDERIAIPRLPSSLLEAAHATMMGRFEYIEGEPILTCNAEVKDLEFEHPPETHTYVLGSKEMEGVFSDELGEVLDDALEELGPFEFELYWYNRRRLSRVDSTGQNKSLRELQDQWSGIMLFRDGFRVFPYGEDRDDWLDLDRKALRRSGYLFNKTQFIGRISISRTKNPHLIDQTNREGLRENEEQQAFLNIVKWATQYAFGDAFATTEREHKPQKTKIVGAASRLKTLEGRVKTAVSGLRDVLPPDQTKPVDEVQHTLQELLAFAEALRGRIDEAEKEGRQLLDMAGVGLMVEVVAHELARSSENALDVLGALKNADVSDEVRSQLSTLQSALKSLSKRIRILDPMSISGRQTREAFDLKKVVGEVLDAHQSQFDRENITVIRNDDSAPVRVHAVQGMVIQVLENLISNSVHWLDVRGRREANLSPTIRISVEANPPLITFEDNGQGISSENSDKVFHPFFSLKEKRKRRGLGLYIAREIASYHKGSLSLSNHVDEETNRLHRFLFELPEEASR
ncbi:MAG: RstB [Blastopirellula sp.]|nr:MAG: RstB [Blastopirellula sp.]